MSFEYYSHWWILTKQQLEELYERDKKTTVPGRLLRSKNVATQLLGGLFAEYSIIVQEIDACLDQLAQPQKRVSIRKLMDAATIRLRELHEELTKIEMSEFHYIDDSLIELKLLPYEVEIIHPALFYPRPLDVEDLVKKIKNGEKIYSPPPTPEPEPTEEESVPEEPVEEAQVVEEEMTEAEKRKASRSSKRATLKKKSVLMSSPTITPKSPHSNAIQLIQTAERGRQLRIYFLEKINEHNLKKTLLLNPLKAPKPLDAEVAEKNARTIQRYWRGRAARSWLTFKEQQRRMLIGMTESSWRSTREFEIFEENLNERRKYRDERIREYLESIDAEKARVVRVVAPGLMEDIGDEIREWFRIWFAEAKTFDQYPPEEKGGTVLVIRGETMTPKEYIDEVERKRREKVKNKGKDKAKEKALKEKLKKQEAEKKKKEAEKKKKEAEKKKKKKRNFADFEYEFEPTTSNNLYTDAQDDFTKLWNQRKDVDNPLEKHYMDLITDQKCFEVQLEVRQKVDELMRLELELLEAALERDRINRGGKKGKKKKKKGKKGKKKKGKKGKKDPTANRTVPDLFQELVDNGIIRQYPTVRLESYHGDFSYKNWDLRNLDFDPPATLLDVRQSVVMNCILPLGVEVTKRPRSVLIAGARQSGKHLLANAIFTETKCVLFDLSPERTAGLYPGKKGLVMLLHLVNKMSRILAPSIIYFDGAEKIFYKKVPKAEKPLDPKRIGKKLLKGIVKTIQSQDRVLVLGITTQPWAAQAAKLKKAFEKNILIPRPDYNSIYMYWRELLMPYHGIEREFNFTALTSATVNYPLSDIKRIVNEILTPRRIIQLKYSPLTVEEVYESFLRHQLEPITDKEYKKYIKWYNKTALGRERVKFNKYAEEKRAAEAKAREKAEKQKKSK